MNRQRFSPITIKKDTITSSKRQTQAPIDDQIENLQQKLRKIRFYENEQTQIKSLWEVLYQLKQAQVKIKQMNEWIGQFGNQLSASSPQREKRHSRIGQFGQYNSSNRVLVSLLNQSQNIKNQINNYLIKSKQIEAQQNAHKIRQSLQYKQQLNEKIAQFQKQLYQQINQTKSYTSYSRKLYDNILKNKIKETKGFMQIQKKKQQYENVIGMLYCIKKNMNDKQLEPKVKARYEKTINIPGYKTKKSMKQMLIQAQKRQTLQKINIELGITNDSILKQANILKNQIKTIQQLFQQNQNQSNNHYHIAFTNLQKLKARIQGTIQNYEYQLQRLQQTLILSRPKIYYIQHKDNQVANVCKKFKQIQQKWLDLQRMLTFQYCNY